MTTDFASVGRLLASPARAAVLAELMDGTARTAGALAAIAGVGAPATSEHLAALESAGLIKTWRSGRHRFVELSGPEVATALEALSLICPPTRVTSLRQEKGVRSLRQARTCYDHLAGRAGVAVHDALIARGLLTRAPYAPTPAGEAWFARLGVDLEAVSGERRAFARPCVDWTERTPHLAGALGAALCTTLLAHGWFVRRPQGRGLAVTQLGRRELRHSLGLHAETWAHEPGAVNAEIRS